MSSSLTLLFSYLRVSWHEFISVAVLEEILPTFYVASCLVSFIMKLADIKNKNSETYLARFTENLSCGFKIMGIFQKKKKMQGK